MNVKKENIVQYKDPKTGKYLKVDKETGVVLSIKSTNGPYKNIPIVEKVWRLISKTGYMMEQMKKDPFIKWIHPSLLS